MRFGGARIDATRVDVAAVSAAALVRNLRAVVVAQRLVKLHIVDRAVAVGLRRFASE